MPKPKTAERAQARRMYVEDGKSPSEIAELLSLSESTVWSWVTKYDWRKEREEHLGGKQSIFELASNTLRVKLTEMQELAPEQITPAMLDGITKLVKVVERAKTEVRVFECVVIAAESFVPFVQREVPDEETRARIFEVWENFLDSVKD